MFKAWIAVIVSAMAVAVLAALIINSRSVDVQDFDAHYQTVSIIDQSVANFESLLDQVASARRDGRPTGSGVKLMRNLLATNKQAIAATAGSSATDVLRGQYLNELQSFVDVSANFSIQQSIIGNALTQIRDNGPAEVQKLKSLGFEVESGAFFRLLLNTLAFGTPGSTVEADSIQSRVDALSSNSELLTGSIVTMIDAIKKVIDNRAEVEQSWSAMSNSNLKSIANRLRGAHSSAHTARMRDVETAQTLLSLFSVALFGGLGLLGFRLNKSYSETNQVNEQLVDVNSSLESRVDERTHELEEAFDNLKESQVQLVQAEKMSSLGQLVAGISHEINTPLLYLQSNQTLIKESLSRVESFVNLCHQNLIPRATALEDKEAIRQRYVKGLQHLKSTLIEEEIKEDVEELLSLTNDNIEGLEDLTTMAQGLKDFSRLDRAPVDSFNVNDGVKRTLVIAKNMLKNQIEIVQQLNEVPLVTCSPSQINQIFLNLITNAAQSIEGSGTVTITTSSEKGYVSVAVSDTGCGIPDEIMAKIRDPFFTTKEVGSGTGLGLSIVEEILRSHNGRLDIVSEVGKGSAFTVLLPYKKAQSSMLGLEPSKFDQDMTMASSNEEVMDDAAIAALAAIEGPMAPEEISLEDFSFAGYLVEPDQPNIVDESGSLTTVT